MKSKKFIQSASLKILQKIKIKQSLSDDEAKAFSILKSLLQKNKNVVIINDVEISVNANNEFLLILR